MPYTQHATSRGITQAEVGSVLRLRCKAHQHFRRGKVASRLFSGDITFRWRHVMQDRKGGHARVIQAVLGIGVASVETGLIFAGPASSFSI